MTTSVELVWLLARLRDARSRRSRLRLLFEAWETVRGLSPSDRLAVARELGFDGAERLVEEVARRQGLDAAPFVEALGGVERSAGREVTDVLRGLADPARRSQTVDELLEGAGRWVADVEAAPHAPPGGDDEVPIEPSEEESDELGISDEEVAPPVVSAPPPVASEVAAQQLPAPVARAGAGDQAARPSTLAPTAPPAVADAALRLAGELSVEPRVLARLRRLYASAGGLAAAPRASLVAVLECFPAGWARRRALERLLAAGHPASVAEAIALVEALARPSERLWALTTLAASRPLNGIEREALLAAVPSPALRRRLERRLGRR